MTSLPRPAPRAPPGAGFPGVPRLRLLSHPGARASPPSPPRARRAPTAFPEAPSPGRRDLGVCPGARSARLLPPQGRVGEDPTLLTLK